MSGSGAGETSEPVRRTKRIAVFCDGTWNMLSAKEPTNVVLGAQMVLPYADADGKQQLVFYKQGVGTSFLVSKELEAWLAGAFGWGLFDNIAEAYRFLVFNYRTGDEIYIFGFSRGAFTARSLAGLIRKCGIVTPDRLDKVEGAFTLYKKRGEENGPDMDEAQRFRAENSPEMIMKDLDREWRASHNYKELYEDLPFFRIKYLGVWDTVGALGVPKHLWAEWLLRTEEKYKFHDPRLSSIVESARHAVAIDEDRLSYAPTLWDNLPELNEERPGKYKELWYPGDHSSVGGGGDIRGLSHAALLWVMEGACEAGLDLDEAFMENVMTAIDFKAPLRAFSAPPRLFSRIYRRGPRTGPGHEGYLSPLALDRLSWRDDGADFRAYRPRSLLPLLRTMFPEEASTTLPADGAAPPLLRRRLMLSSVAMVLTAALLILLHIPLYVANQPDIVVLQGKWSGQAMRAVVRGWNEHGVATWALAAMLFDYAFMLAYGIALYLGARAAYFGFTSGAGPLAAALRAAAVLAVAGAMLDAVENALQLWIAFRPAPDALADAFAPVAFAVTIAKWVCIAAGSVAWLAGMAALFAGRLAAQR